MGDEGVEGFSWKTVHSSGIGVATRLAPSRSQAWAVQREGRWKRDVFRVYATANRKYEERVSQALTQNAKAGGIQPGQGTMWGRGRVDT